MMPPVGKSGAGMILHQRLDRQIGVLDQRQRGVDHLAQVVRRNVGRHADGDAARAIDQHVREPRGQDRGFPVLAVVIVLKIDGILFDIGQQGAPRACPSALRCSAWRRGYRRPSSRSCPDRPEAAATSRNPAPSAPARRRSRYRHAGGTCPSRRRPGGRICGRICRGCCRFRASRTRMRRCTGFSPSRRSGIARLTITLIA